VTKVTIAALGNSSVLIANTTNFRMESSQLVGDLTITLNKALVKLLDMKLIGDTTTGPSLRVDGMSELWLKDSLVTQISTNGSIILIGAESSEIRISNTTFAENSIRSSNTERSDDLVGLIAGQSYPRINIQDSTFTLNQGPILSIDFARYISLEDVLFDKNEQLVESLPMISISAPVTFQILRSNFTNNLYANSSLLQITNVIPNDDGGAVLTSIEISHNEGKSHWNFEFNPLGTDLFNSFRNSDFITQS